MMYNRNKAEEMMIEAAVNKIGEGIEALQQHGIDIKTIHVGSPDEQFGIAQPPYSDNPYGGSKLPTNSPYGVMPQRDFYPQTPLPEALQNPTCHPYEEYERIAARNKGNQCDCPNPFMSVTLQRTPNFKPVDILPVYPDGSVDSPFPAELSEEVKNTLTTLDKDLGKVEPLIKPATISRDYIGTPDQRFMTFNAPTTFFNGVLNDLNELGDVAPVMDPAILRRIFGARCVAILKQIIITSFNMNQNCDTEDMMCELNNSVLDRDFVVTVKDFTVRREVRDMFYTRETLDMLLSLVDSDFAFGFYVADDIFETNDSTLNMAFLILSKIYEQCLNRVDSSHDVECLNYFIEMLLDRIPVAFVNLRRELMEIYRLDERKAEYSECKLD